MTSDDQDMVPSERRFIRNMIGILSQDGPPPAGMSTRPYGKRDVDSVHARKPSRNAGFRRMVV